MILVREGDCRLVMPALVAEGVVVDAIVTDPPYGLEFMGKDWDKLDAGLPQEAQWKGRRGKGGAGIGADDSKPGSRHRVGYGGGRAAFKRCELCGKRAFSGSPCRCEAPQWVIEYPEGAPSSAIRMQRWHEQWARDAYALLRPGGFLLAFGGTRTAHRLACAIEDAGFVIQDTLAWLYGTGFPKHRAALKPAYEPIVLVYKPGGKRTLQVDECRIGTESTLRNSHAGTNGDGWGLGKSEHINGSELGRWPANICHDGSDEVVALFPQAPGALRTVKGTERAKKTVHAYGEFGRVDYDTVPRGDTGSAARFFFSAKAGRQDRWGSRHPTVKPVELLKWLVPLVTPKAGLVLDPFAGSGTTGVAALATGRNCIMVEREAEYVADIRERLAFYEGGGQHSSAAKGRNRKAAPGPLFAEVA